MTLARLRKAAALGLLLGSTALAHPAKADPAPAEQWWMLQARIASLTERARSLSAGLHYAHDAALDVNIMRVRRDIALAGRYLSEADALRQQGQDFEGAELWADLAAFSLHDGSLMLTPSRTVEARGILIDVAAMPRTPAAARALIDRLADAHFNIVLPETLYRGYSLYPSAILERDPEFAGAPDILPAMISEAHARGMELIPWIWTFRVRSYDARHDYGNPVLSKYPGLAARTAGTIKPRFMSPANPLSRQLIHEELTELVGRYDVDGLFLDYIRYDEKTPDDWTSRTDYALTQLDLPQRRIFGGDVATGEVREAAEIARRYQIWREEQVDQTVKDVHDLLKHQRRPLDLGVATFRSQWYSRQTKLQDWRNWADNKWTSFTTEMLYSSRAQDVSRWIDQETDGDSRPTLFYPILGVFKMAHPMQDLLAQIRAVRDSDQPGIFLFSLSHMNDAMLDELARGPFREPALIPQRNLLGAAHQVLSETLWRYLHRQTFPSGDWGTISAARVMATEIDSVLKRWPHPRHLVSRGPGLERHLRDLTQVVQAMDRANSSFVTEMARRLTYAADLVRDDDYQLARGRYVPPTLPSLESFLLQAQKEAGAVPERLASKKGAPARARR